jgi:hypothetical protein
VGPLEDLPDAAAGRRRFSSACVVAGAAAAVWFCWMVTGGTFDFFQSQLFSNLYDAQARALLHGHWWMPADVLKLEAIRTGSHSYMYFGPVPAILRIPVLLLTSRLDGRLTAPSMLLAFVVALAATGRIAWKVRNLVRRSPHVGWAEASVGGASVACIGAGSAFFFLASRPTIYHEAELWGAALALAAFDALLSFLLRPSGGWLAAAGALGAASLLTRASVGAGPIAATGILAAAAIALAAVRCLEGTRRRGAHSPARRGEPAGRRALALLGTGEDALRVRWLAGLLAATLVPVLLYVWINEVKFHTLFSLPLNRQAFTAMSASRKATLAANGGSLFGARFVPTALLQYLRPDNLSLHRLFPFIGFPGPATVIGNVRYDSLDWSSSATATMPALVLTGVAGLVASFGRRYALLGRADRGAAGHEAEGQGLATLRVPLAASAVGGVGALSIAYVANRYLSDFMPFIVLASLAGVFSLVSLASGAHPWLRAGAAVLLGALGLFGIWVNFALGITYQRALATGVPTATRAGFVSFQEDLDKALFGNPSSGVSTGPSLPKPGPVGQLFILGHCEGLYQSDGREWAAVERSRGAGLVRMRVSFSSGPRGARQPLLVTGSAGQGDFLAVRYLGHDTVAMSYLFQSSWGAWSDGAPVRVVPGRTYTLDAVLDSRVHEVEVTLDGRTVLDEGYYVFVRPASTFYVGYSPFPGPLEPRFGGRIRQIPAPTPICHALLARMGKR